ncbi:hypothetical protein [Methylophilus sp. QUAN]|uniref:hypothetical protein n=1 Tax=Methylophilus sp. QUAN TaxID=2781020 RepID=UPI00188F69B4|nr:hypothetical protein [Methylophilus sp. QUAN]MBF4991109.1 hypothetical protein [Methylophilus sp. QUAN]
MDKFKAQEVVDEIEAICKKHNVALIGGSITDGLYGEIQIIHVDDLTDIEIDHLSSGDTPYLNKGYTVVNGIS